MQFTWSQVSSFFLLGRGHSLRVWSFWLPQSQWDIYTLRILDFCDFWNVPFTTKYPFSRVCARLALCHSSPLLCPAHLRSSNGSEYWSLGSWRWIQVTNVPADLSSSPEAYLKMSAHKVQARTKYTCPVFLLSRMMFLLFLLSNAWKCFFSFIDKVETLTSALYNGPHSAVLRGLGQWSRSCDWSCWSCFRITLGVAEGIRV